MSTLRDLTGHVFGELTVLSRHGSDRHKKATWLCRCACDDGKTVVKVGSELVKGNTRSCGHLRGAQPTHGLRRTREYAAWGNMIQRCTTDQTNRNYPYYYGRGIKVFQEWKDSFEEFFIHVGARPSPKHSLDRIDNDGNYEPENVRWATKSEQRLNQRKRVTK